MLARQGVDAEVLAEAALEGAVADLAAEELDSAAADLAADEAAAGEAGVDQAIPMLAGQIEPMRDS